MAVYERMMITHLSLTNFRNYTRLELNLPEGITLLQGDNAQGKTNLLESIYYLATSRSPQAGSDVEVVNWLVRDDPMACVRLVAEVKWDGKTQRLELTLVPANNPRSSSPTFRKQIRVNGAPKRAMDLIGLVNVVIFRPQDIDLVAGAPSARRRYLDAMLCQIDNCYCRSLQMYNRVLSQRNCLLRTLRERSGDESQLNFWDERLIENGAYIFARRRDALLGLDRLARAIHRDVT
jgi:DNA replication and repair protein RecF